MARSRSAVISARKRRTCSRWAALSIGFRCLTSARAARSKPRRRASASRYSATDAARCSVRSSCAAEVIATHLYLRSRRGGVPGYLPNTTRAIGRPKRPRAPKRPDRVGALGLKVASIPRPRSTIPAIGRSIPTGPDARPPRKLGQVSEALRGPVPFEGPNPPTHAVQARHVPACAHGGPLLARLVPLRGSPSIPAPVKRRGDNPRCEPRAWISARPATGEPTGC